ncbi:MAG: ATP-binding cassette domain-containing protein, partial [Bdellovibrionales bacterium]|nr:ATP-binding cassette domain-containing protein [Bdellovibrionales bacterium]
LRKEGFSRILRLPKKNLKTPLIQQIAELKSLPKERFFILVDRLIIETKEKSRLTDSISQTFQLPSLLEGFPMGKSLAVLTSSGDMRWFSPEKQCPVCQFQFPFPLTAALFSFNSPLGACQTCEGYGYILVLDEKKVIPNPILPIIQGAIRPFDVPSGTRWQRDLRHFCRVHRINVYVPWCDLPALQRQLIWKGNHSFEGVEGFFRSLEYSKYKMHIRIFISRFRSPRTCPECKGSRLRKEISSVHFRGKPFPDYMKMTLEKIQKIFEKPPPSVEKKKCEESLESLRKNLKYLNSVGLSYLTLDRPVNTLSGGEFQRLNLSNQLGMALSQVLYVLDEPTVGLHPKDTKRMIEILKDLKDIGNTIVVVEHDPEVIENGSYIIEMGPAAGIQGGKVLWSGPRARFSNAKTSNTLSYLNRKEVLLNPSRRTNIGSHKFMLTLKGCSGHNLKDVDLKLPLNRFVAVTGVSGSGKSSLIRDTLYPALKIHLKKENASPLPYTSLSGENFLKDIILMDQSDMGASSRSSPVSYLKVFDSIRQLFAESPQSRKDNLSPYHFSLNVEGGGRCPACKGTGSQEIDMVFMDPVTVICEECKGKKFQQDILNVRYNGKNIFEVLNLTVDEASVFFKTRAPLLKAFFTLKEVGLSYLRLGQDTRSLSGGERQRLKLARELLHSLQKKTLYIFDEPTKGLHFREIDLLLKILHRLTDSGGSVVVIEHNLEVIKEADYIIDMGPLAGNSGGQIVAQGPLSSFLLKKKSHTAQYLKQYLKGKKSSH